MERMKLERKNKNLKENLDIERRGHLQLARRVKQLEEENNALRENVNHRAGRCADLSEDKEELEEENKTLKECNKSQSEVINNVLIPQRERLEEEIRKLKEKISEITMVADDEKQSIEHILELEEENKKLKEYQYWAKDKIEGLQYENKKLKSDLSECECSFGFESDEVGFWKGEYKRLKKWIKDHCKGYGNLFPEDEMKRQWKKADKKRK